MWRSDAAWFPNGAEPQGGESIEQNRRRAQARGGRPRTSDLRPQTSDLRPRTSDLRLRTSDLRRRTSDLRLRTSGLGRFEAAHEDTRIKLASSKQPGAVKKVRGMRRRIYSWGLKVWPHSGSYRINDFVAHGTSPSGAKAVANLRIANSAPEGAVITQQLRYA